MTNPHTTTTPNACLIAILLIVRDSSGDKLTFHYPPKPSVEPTSSTSTFHRLNHPGKELGVYTDGGTSSQSESNSDVPSSGDEEDDRQSRTTAYEPGAPGTVTAGGGAGGGGRTATERSDSGSRSRSYIGGRRRSRKALEEDQDERKGDESTRGLPWETILGFKADFLAGLLAPKASMCKTKFELTIDDVVFLGFPLHVRPDGTWRKKKKRRRDDGDIDDDEVGEDGDVDVEREGGENGDSNGLLNGEGEVEKKEDRGGDGEQNTVSSANDAYDDADDEKDDEEGSSTHDGGMSMFHVVFVLNPPELEYHFRTQEIFDYVIKRFARALKYEQAKDGYVWREAVKISRLRDKAVQEGAYCTTFLELWKQILEQSSLAYAMSRIYTDISQSKIAHIFLNNNLGLSLQIPIITETAVLPSITDPQIPGLPLTTADSFGDDENEGDNMLARHFTLLFLVDVESILKEIAAETAESSNSLAHFVKACKPSLSFLQISNVCGIPLHDIQLMARHLIHWRKARAIPPIHQRDIYIVSPNADMKRLHFLIPIYARLFPTLPTLPKILSLLSSKPKAYSTFIPSKDHRSAYLEILAWLIRHGLVTQLRNFAWIRVTRDIKIKVAREKTLRNAEKERQEREKSRSKSRSRSVSPGPGGEKENGKGGDKMASSISSLLSSGLSLPDAAEGGPSGPLAAAAVTTFDEPEEDDSNFQDSIILEPHQASSIESAWLEMMTRDKTPDVTALFDRIMKYLNGQHAIEKIAVREGISRRDVRRVLNTFEEFVVYARHW